MSSGPIGAGGSTITGQSNAGAGAGGPIATNQEEGSVNWWLQGRGDVPTEEIFADPSDESVYVKTVSALGVFGNKELLMPVELRRSHLAYLRGEIKTSDEFKFWNSEEGKAFLKSFDDAEFLLGTLTEIVVKISDPEIVECLKKESDKQLRNFFEVSTPITQCNNTIGPVKPGETLCWICGTVIPRSNYKGLLLSPECEHVLPVAQALVFSGLYEAQLFRELEDEFRRGAYIAGVSLEYKWAHRVCNQVKNDSHFISYVRDGENGQFVIEDKKIADLLNEIENTGSWGNQGRLFKDWIVKENGLDYENWRATAISNIHTVSQTLLDYAQKSGLTPKEHAKLTVMCMRSFIATSKTCVPTVEVIKEFKVPSEETKGAVPAQPYVGRVGLAPAVAVAEHYIKRTTEDMTGILQSALNAIGRGGGLDAKKRANISIMLPRIEELVFNELQKEKDSIIEKVRQQALYFVKNRYKKNYAGITARGIFDVLITQLLPGAVFEYIAGKGLEIILVSVAEDAANYSEENVNSLRQVFKVVLDKWVTAKFDIINRGLTNQMVTYSDIMSLKDTDDIDPSWFSKTGGGKRSTRRPLYG